MSSSEPSGTCIFQNYYGRCEPPKFGCTSYLSGPKELLKFGSESVLHTIVTIALQYSLAGGQCMVSSNTITASLSHNTPKSMFGQKLLSSR